MNRSLTPASREREGPAVEVVHDRRAVVAYSYGLAAAAVAVAVGAALGGSPFPRWWPLLVLALSMWFTANRFAFFPSEFAVTAEPAVVFVAVVGFAGDAWILGPMMVAMLVGPLDRRFWEQRAFVRMAYNTGWQGLAAAVAAVTFRGATAALGSSGAATVAAILLAAVPYFAFDSLMAAVLVALRRAPDVGAMVRHIVVLNTVEFPFAAYAGVVGVLALAHGWWLALVLLAPLPGLPELLFVRVRRSWTTSGRQCVARAALLVAVVAGTAALSPWSRVGELAVLFALAIALGAELRATPVAPVAPLTMLVVSTTACASAGAGVPEASVAVALVALLVSWSPERRLPSRAVIVAIAAGAATATLVDAVYGSSTASLVGAGFAGTSVGLTLVVAASSAMRRSVAGAVAWCAPLFAAATLAGVVWRLEWGAGAFAAAVLVPFAVVGAGCWGSPPWPSRTVGRATARTSKWAHGAFVAVVAGAVAAGFSAVRVEGRASETLVLLAAVGADAALAMAAFGVRQWRLAPRGRRRDALLLVTAGAAINGAYVPLGLAGRGVAPVLLLAAIVVVGGVAAKLPPRRQGRRTPRTAVSRRPRGATTDRSSSRPVRS